MNQLDAAIYTKLTGAAALTGLLSAGTASVFQTLAPENENPPYVVFHKQSNVPAYTFGGVAFENALYLVKAVTQEPSAKTAGSVASQINAALQDAALTIDGYTHMYLRRETDIEFVEVESGQVIHHRGALFRVQADPA